MEFGRYNFGDVNATEVDYVAPGRGEWLRGQTKVWAQEEDDSKEELGMPGGNARCRVPGRRCPKRTVALGPSAKIRGELGSRYTPIPRFVYAHRLRPVPTRPLRRAVRASGIRREVPTRARSIWPTVTILPPTAR